MHECEAPAGTVNLFWSSRKSSTQSFTSNSQSRVRPDEGMPDIQQRSGLDQTAVRTSSACLPDLDVCGLQLIPAQ
jgi:hypothetical protein